MLATIGGGRDSVRSERSTSFLCYAKLGEFAVKCSDAVTVEVDILCHTLAFFACHTVAEVVSRTILYHLKKD